MSFFDVAQSFVESDVADVGNKALPALMRQGLSEGLSGNQMLQGLRSIGISISTQRFYGLLGEINATSAMHEGVAGLDLNAELTEENFAPWTTARANGYLYQIRAYFQSVDPVTGQIIRTFKPFDVRSSSILRGYEAIAQAMDYIPLGGDVGSDGSLVGLEITGLFHMFAGGKAA